MHGPADTADANEETERRAGRRMPMSETGKQSGLPRKAEAPVNPLTISDVDIDIGMLNSGGKLCVYRGLLSEFCRDAEEKEERLKQAARKGNAALCIILLHALKDESADIGAIGLARRAMWLADAARSGEPVDMREKTDALLKDKRLLIERIHAALERSARGDESRVIKLRAKTPKAGPERARPNRSDARRKR
jgi:HPt (histidine-containing phosphotransfer) domain-containing protein